MAEYDIFEIFADGSFRWCGYAVGEYDKQRKLQQYQETSVNRFYAINISAGETLPTNLLESRPAQKAARAGSGEAKKTG
jgi:hypothetical protein